MLRNQATHNIMGVVAAIILAAVAMGVGVYFFNYFKSAKKDIVANDKTIEILREGTGEGAKRGDTVSVHYIGSLTDGTQFDNSYRRGEPIEVILGDGQVIRGWEEGLLGMKVGEKRKLTIPPSLGYGADDYGPIPGGSTLIFETEMMSIKRP